MLLESSDNDKIIHLEIDIAMKASREFILFKRKEIEQSGVIGFIKMFFEHCGYDHQITGTKVNKFRIRHELSAKGFIFLNTYVETVIKDILGIESQSVVTDNSFTIKF